MFTRSKSKKRKLHHLEDLNPLSSKKTRKKDPINPISLKTPREKPSKSSPLTTININDISETPPQTIPSLEDDWKDIESIINRPISTKTTYFNNLEQYENLSPVDEDDWRELANFINETDPPQDDINFNNLEQYENLSPVDEDDWRELANFINETDPPQDDINFNNLEQYENLATIDQSDLDEILYTDTIQIPTPIINTPPIKPLDNNIPQNLPIYETVFTAEELVKLSSIVNGINLEDSNKFNLPSQNNCNISLSTEIPFSDSQFPIPPAPTSATPPSDTDSNPHDSTSPSATPDSDSKQSFNLTSEQLFKIMEHSANSSIKEVELNPSIFNPIKDPYLDNIIDKYNKTILSKSLSPINSVARYTGFRSNIRKNNSKIFSFIKSTYLKIYPAQRILDLIEENPDELKCICFLEHEEKLTATLNTFKTKQNDFRSTPSLRPNRIAIRLKVIQNLVAEVRDIFKKIYKLN